MTEKLTNTWNKAVKIKNQIREKTDGQKTKSAAILLAIYYFIDAIKPNLIFGQTEIVVNKGIDLMIITGAADWIWRNRKNIADKVLSVFHK